MHETTILVVDDDQDIACNVSDILVDAGYRVDVANDGSSALELVRTNAYDIALLDYCMPDMDGASLYDQIRKIQPSMVAIMITAHAGHDGVQRAKDAGTWHVLRKPVDIRRLLDLVQEAADQPIILVVDDDTDFCNNLWQILRERGYRVSIANSEDEARARLSDRQYQVVLLDLVLRQMLSTEIFAEIRRQCPSTATIVITGERGRSEAAEEMVAHGADCLQYKPLDISSLLNRIDTLVH